MLSELEQWETMEPVDLLRWRMGDVRVLIVTTGRARDTLPVDCPVCGEPVEEVRRWSDGGRRSYFTLHEGRDKLCHLGAFGCRRKGRKGKGK